MCIRDRLADSIEEIFQDINKKIFETEHVDLQHLYIDGSKFEAKDVYKRQVLIHSIFQRKQKRGYWLQMLTGKEKQLVSWQLPIWHRRHSVP